MCVSISWSIIYKRQQKNANRYIRWRLKPRKTQLFNHGEKHIYWLQTRGGTNSSIIFLLFFRFWMLSPPPEIGRVPPKTIKNKRTSLMGVWCGTIWWQTFKEKKQIFLVEESYKAVWQRVLEASLRNWIWLEKNLTLNFNFFFLNKILWLFGERAQCFFL